MPIELNKIYCENALKTMGRMPDGFIDLTVTSPPYDKLRDYKGYDFDFEGIAKELYRVTKDGGVVVWIVGDATVNGSETGTSFRQALFFIECGFNLHDTMIYHRHAKNTDSIRYRNDFEYMFVLSKGKPQTFNPIKVMSIRKKGERVLTRKRGKDGALKQDTCHKKLTFFSGEKTESNIWSVNSGWMSSTKDISAYDHPAIMPEKLVAQHIVSWSNEGDIVYDPCMGSGTTAKAAHLLKRQWLGSELSQEYVDLANKRIKPYLDQISMF